MIVLRGHVDHRSTNWSLHDDAASSSLTIPVGSASLTAIVSSDPPRPDDLTNAIGLFVDHLDDVTRELSAAPFADRIELHGPGLHTLAKVEVGGDVDLPFVLRRDAAEEVFRTLATESDAERVHNPGLPADECRSILGVTCAVVAVLRALDRTELVVVTH